MTEKGNEFLNPEITPEASALLDQRLSELRDKVIQVAIRERAAESTGSPEVVADDIVSALVKLNIATEDAARQELKWFRSKQFLFIYIGIFSIIAPVLLVYASRSLIGEFDPWNAVLSIALSSLGALAAGSALWLSRRAASKSKVLAETVSNAASESELLSYWAQIEQAMRDRIFGESGDVGARLSLMKVMKEYADLAGFSIDEFEELMHVLKVRNSIVHFSLRDPDALRDAIPLARKHLRRARAGR
jgi:hypothetical protein